MLGALDRASPKFRFDLRRHLPLLLASGLAEWGKPLPWRDCTWAETLCQLVLPQDTQVFLLDQDNVFEVPGSSAIHVVRWLRGSVWTLGQDAIARLVGAGTWSVAPEGGALLFSDGRQVVLALPLHASGCVVPRGFAVPLRAAATWALGAIAPSLVAWRTESEGDGALPSRGLLLALVYVCNNVFLALKHSGNSDVESAMTPLKQLSWKLIETAGLHFFGSDPSEDPSQELIEYAGILISSTVQVLAGTGGMLQAASWGQPFAISAPRLPRPMAASPRSPFESIEIAGVRVPAVGLHTAGLDASRCGSAVEWALDLGVQHVHVDGSGGCLDAASRVLRAMGSPPFVSVSLLGDCGSEAAWRVVSHATLDRIGAEWVDLLVAPHACIDFLEASWDRKPPVAFKNVPNCRGHGFRQWSVYTRVDEASPGDVVQMHTHSGLEVPLPGAGDPHVTSIAEDVGRPPQTVLARYNLQRGSAVLLDVPAEKAELAESLDLNFVLGFAHTERLRALPGLASLVAGDKVPGAYGVDVYGLGDIHPDPRLPPAVADELEDALRAAFGFWRDLPCLRFELCEGGDDALDASAVAACLLGTFRKHAHVPTFTRPGAPATEQEDGWAEEAARHLRGRIPDLKQAFEAMTAPRYVVVDDFLPAAVAEGIARELPQRDLCTLLGFCEQGNLSCSLDPESPTEFMRFRSDVPVTPFAQWVHRFMHSEPFLHALQQIYGVEVQSANLQGTYFEQWHGGFLGIHEDVSNLPYGGAGRVPHRDYRVARLNILLYTHDLDDSSTGHLEFWEQKSASRIPTRPVARVAPRQNRLVIIDTIAGIHGLPWPLRGKQSRRALQWYYEERRDDAEGPIGVGIRFHAVPDCGGASCYEGTEVI